MEENQKGEGFDNENFRTFLKDDSEDNFLNNLDFIKFLLVARKNLIYILFIFTVYGSYFSIKLGVEIRN